MSFEISVYCCLCGNSHKTTIDLPPGWTARYGGVDCETGFCPDHSAVGSFAEAQCPGCVGGWGDCDMWRAFAYTGMRSMTARDYEALEAGKCPRRTNGTIEVSPAGIGDIDLSERAPNEAGTAFAKAIRDYIERYPDRS